MCSFRSLCTLILLYSVVGCSAGSVPRTAVTVSEAESAAIKALQAAGAAVKTNTSGSATDIDLHKISLSDETLSSLTNLKSLQVLNLADTSFSDESLSILEGVSPGLISLDLRGCPISDKATTVITRFANLKALRFNGKNGQTGISDDGVRSLAACKSLKVLALDELTFVGTDGLAALTGLKDLQELYVGGTIVDDDSCRVIASFPNLRKLRLSRDQVSDAGLEILSDCSQLEELDLSEDSLISDAGMASVAKLKALKKLNLWRVQISDAGVLMLAPLVNLDWLNLDNTKLSDAGLSALSDMTKLSFLHLGSTQITADGAPALFHLTTLKDLKITRSAMGASDAAVAELKKHLPNTAIQTEYLEPE